jgi:hypothetical protein
MLFEDGAYPSWLTRPRQTRMLGTDAAYCRWYTLYSRATTMPAGGAEVTR